MKQGGSVSGKHGTKKETQDIRSRGANITHPLLSWTNITHLLLSWTK